MMIMNLYTMKIHGNTLKLCCINIYDAPRRYNSIQIVDRRWIVDPHHLALQKCVNSVAGADSLRHGGTSCRSSCVTGERAAIFVQDGL